MPFEPSAAVARFPPPADVPRYSLPSYSREEEVPRVTVLSGKPAHDPAPTLAVAPALDAAAGAAAAAAAGGGGGGGWCGEGRVSAGERGSPAKAASSGGGGNNGGAKGGTHLDHVDGGALAAAALYRRPAARRRKHTTMVTKSEFREIVAARTEGRRLDLTGHDLPGRVPLPGSASVVSPARASAGVGNGVVTSGGSPAAIASGAAASPGSTSSSPRGKEGNQKAMNQPSKGAARLRMVSVLLDDDELACLHDGREAMGLPP